MTRRTAQSTQTAQDAQEPQEAQSVQEPQEAQDGQAGQTAQEGQDALDEVTDEQREALLAQLREQAEALGLRLASKTERKPRTPKLTDKQQAFLRALRANPSASLEELVSAAHAGGSTEPHGFVYRMVANGYLDISVSAKAEALMPSEASDAEAA